MCFIKFWKQGHEMYRNTWDLARILPSRFVEGDIRHVDLSDESPPMMTAHRYQIGVKIKEQMLTAMLKMIMTMLV